MYIYAQHGYGKSDKIEAGIRGGHISGVILSPRDEQPDNMSQFVGSLRREFGDRAAILFDPQFYAATVSPVRDGYLSDYPYYQPGLARGRFIAQRDIHRYVADTLAYQVTLGLDRIISPSVLFDDFRDPWSQISLSMAQESMTVHSEMQGAPPLLVSLIVDEYALRHRDALDEFLDIISVWETKGFYLVIRRNDPNYPATFEEVPLTNLMYLVYVLAEINGFEVVSGYTDLAGFLLHAVGAEATGTGWFNSLRQFSLSRFQPATGGRQPRPRYTSLPLLNSILVVPELATAYNLDAIGQILSNSVYDGAMRAGNPAGVPWPLHDACLHHWDVLTRVAAQVSSQGSVGDNLTALEERIRQGMASYALLQGAGVPFEPSSGPRHLELWLRTIRSFRVDAGI